MAEYITRRLLIAVVTIFLISIIIFSIIWIPYKPTIIITWPPDTTPEQREEMEKGLLKELGIEKSTFHVAYSRWIGGVFTDDIGTAFMDYSDN